MDIAHDYLVCRKDTFKSNSLCDLYNTHPGEAGGAVRILRMTKQPQSLYD